MTTEARQRRRASCSPPTRRAAPRCRPSIATRAATDAPRAVADYIAGMTDRFACASTARLFAVGDGLIGS